MFLYSKCCNSQLPFKLFDPNIQEPAPFLMLSKESRNDRATDPTKAPTEGS